MTVMEYSVIVESSQVTTMVDKYVFLFHVISTNILFVVYMIDKK